MNSGRWRFGVWILQTLELFCDPVARDGPEQMALDEALLETATRPVLRVYRWSVPAVSFGYCQSLASVKRGKPPFPLVRRWTGGGIVEHASDWTFSLVVPAGEPLARLRPGETYRLLHEVLADALAGGARLVQPAECARGEACFTSPALHDVTADGGRKLCGGAQRRTRRGFLHQGSIQNVTPSEDFAWRAAGALAEMTGTFTPARDLPARTQELVVAKYGSQAWMERTA